MATRQQVLNSGARLTCAVLAAAAFAAAAAPSGSGRVEGEAAAPPIVTRCAGTAPSTQQQTLLRARTTAAPSAYDWPLAPFDRQHPVRGFFNDPRDGAHDSHSFHFGIDISAPDGTPVYAVKAGRVHKSSGRAVAVAEPSGRVLAYWHIVPVVVHGQQVGRHQLLGHIEAPWGHVHFAELRNGVYVNPLRPGALGPYRDNTAPTIAGARVSLGTSPEVVVDAYDTTPVRVPPPWHAQPVTPVLLTWRVLRGDRVVVRSRVGVDFRAELLPAARFSEIYAPDTRKNSPPRAGRYCFRLAGAGALARLAAGEHRLEVTAHDTQGNAAVATFPLRLR